MPDANLKPPGSGAPPLPTHAYDEARNSPVYRLSELMFGSLLASYVIGFINSTATLTPAPPPPVNWNNILGQHMEWAWWPARWIATVGPFVAISLTYAYVTAGLYLAYHAGILTMPSMPLRRLRWDFALALAQTVFFGFSITKPETFGLCLGLMLLGSLLRQHSEHKYLVDALWTHYFPSADLPDSSSRWYRGEKPKNENPAPKKFRIFFNKTLREKSKNGAPKYPKLSGWTNVQVMMLVLVGIALVVGILVWCIIINVPTSKAWLIPLQTMISGLIVSIYVHKTVLKHRASFLYNATEDQQEMDEQFRGFSKELELWEQ